MKRHTVDTVMTRDVVSVRPNASFKQIATLLAEHDISAVPVTDYQEQVIGIVSEVDLLAAQARPEIHRRPWQRSSRTVRTVATELMTSPAITVRAGTDITAAARLLADRDIHRAPVVDDDNRLVGIVSRHDLVRVFARPDEEIRSEIGQDVFRHTLSVDPHSLDIRVADGIVTLRGQLARSSLLAVAGTMCRQVDGVVDVVNELTYALDDSTPRGFGDPGRP